MTVNKYTKIHLLLLAAFFALFSAKAQEFGFEWINFNQTYYKIPTSADGIYRLTYQELQDAGFPVDSVDPRKIQLFFRGNEQAILVSGETDRRFDSDDYIEFYGKRNDGTVDALMYESPNHQPTPYRNIYSDVTYVFLTVGQENGKRMQIVRSSGGSRINYHLEEIIRADASHFSHGQHSPPQEVNVRNVGFNSNWIEGKGFTFPPFRANQNNDFNLSIRNFLEGTRGAKFEATLTGGSSFPHQINILVGPSADSLRLLGEVNFNNFDNARFSASLQQSDFNLTDNTIFVRFQGVTVGNNPGVELAAVASFIVSYPQEIDARQSNREEFNIVSSGTSARLTINNVLPESRIFDITSQNNVRIIQGNINNNQQFVGTITQSNIDRKLWLTAQPRSVNAPITIAEFGSLKPESNFLIISHEYFTQSVGEVANPVQSYADYRSSSEGGNFKVDVKLVGELYNLFTYGEVTPFAMRRYTNYMLQNGQPEFLFLIGKGLDRRFEFERRKPTSLSWTHQSWIPCYGRPCSDIAITEGLKGSEQEGEPAIPTGRLAAFTPEHTVNYLNKVIETEANPVGAEWRKRILHLSGGKSNSEQVRFRANIDSYKRIAEGNFLGGQVKTLSKITTDQVEFIDVVEEVNDGVGLITFFGHSGQNFSDITIGYVTSSLLNYENKGRYPMLFLNGCLSGNIFLREVSLGENWMYAKDRGGVHFLAHTHLGFSLSLHRYATSFYNNILGDSTQISKPIGLAIKEHIRRHVNENDGLSISHAQQFILQGDPSMPLVNVDKPDYQIDDSSLAVESFDSRKKLDAAADSFNLKIDVKNLGIVNQTDIEILVARTFSDGRREVYPSRFYPRVPNQEIINFSIRNSVQDKINGVGRNIFEVTIDPENIISEVREYNNFAQTEIIFQSGAMETVSPREFSIVNNQTVTLIGQNKNILNPEREYQFQLDTTDLFNSPILKDTTVFSGLLPRWTTSLLSDNPLDSIVYYYRVRYAQPAENENSDWAESSFLHIQNGPKGWSQSHFPQFKANELIRLDRDDTTRKFSFQVDDRVLKVTAVGNAAENPNNYEITYQGNTLVNNSACGQGRILFMRISSVTGKIEIVPYQLGNFSLSCGAGEPGSATFIDAGNLVRFNSVNLIANDANKDDFIMVTTVGNFQWSRLTNRDFVAFERYGVNSQILRERVRNGEPVIIFGKNNSPVGSATVVFADTSISVPPNQQTIEGSFNIAVDAASGIIVSPRIGPALSWESTHFNFDGIDNSQDIQQVDVIGVDFRGNEAVIVNDIQNGTSLNNFPSEIFPFLKLQVTLSDRIRSTASQLDFWQIYYKEPPEGILLYNPKQNELETITVDEGVDTSFDLEFINISSTDFSDSLIVEYRLQNLETNRVITSYDTLETLSGGQTLSFLGSVSTQDMAGENKLRIYINPEIQLEQNYENNIIEIDFEIVPDETNPILDVVFDGVHILDGEIVSPNPLITVSLKDENELLIRTDTTGIDMFLAQCEDCSFSDASFDGEDQVFRRIPLSSPEVSWVANENNEFQIFYQPELEDGKYILVVQGEDLAGNPSGLKPFRVQFEVISQSSITNFYPYPNPFSDNVRFVFTLTGREIPDELKIQILTVSGKVVREITQDEIGPIRVGNNISQISWDGKDEFGGQLANGVYLYRVVTQKNGESFEKRETAGDNLFKNGFGKLYLLR